MNPAIYHVLRGEMSLAASRRNELVEHLQASAVLQRPIGQPALPVGRR
jgi:hypothetical protein